MLRNLKIEDALFMLEWMHDEDITQYLKRDFTLMTLEDCVCFIKNSWNDDRNCHLAIAAEDGEYLGTVSLKEIDNRNKRAEFGIVIRKKAMGTGIAIKSMREIFEYGVNIYNIELMYWCVSPLNRRAVRFYEKNKFERILDVKNFELKRYSEEEVNTFYWFMLKAGVRNE